MEDYFTNPQLEALCDIVSPTRRAYYKPKTTEPELVGCASLYTPWGLFEVSLYPHEMIVHCPDPKDPERFSASLSFYKPEVDGYDLIFAV